MAKIPSDPTDEEIREGKIFAVLSYLSIFCIIPLIVKKENTFALRHSKQGLVLFIAQVGGLIISIVFPFVLKPIFFILGVCSLWGIAMVLQGRFVRLPVIADIADQITL